jgi:hypothetical protein
MRLTDGILIAVLAGCIMAWVAVTFFSTSPIYALSVDAGDVDGLRSYIENVLKDCQVNGEVYVYDLIDSEGFGSISSARIRC